MESTLLNTKVHIPPTTHRLVCRPALVAALDAGVSEHTLTAISAPPGYGKTTLLAEWARATGFQVAWLSIDAEDNDPQRFYRCLLESWNVVQPNISESSLDLILGSLEPDLEAAGVALLNAASDLTEHMALVLDDFHLITDEPVLTSMSFLIDHAPPMLHFVLAGRGEPRLPLARYRARDKVLELHAADLRFSDDETRSLLNRLTGRELGDNRILAIQTQLEGWIAGLQLVGLGMRRGLTEADQPVVSGKHRFVADYLTGDVLATLPDADRRFLLQTCILERVSGPLCDAVTGDADGQQQLERLEREDLFLEPLDDHREWFRFHPLFASVLREELALRQPETVAELHRRAALWHLEHGLPEPAFRHAVASGDPDLVASIADRYVMVMLYRGDVRLVAEWLESIPPEWSESQPLFGLVRVGWLMFSGQFAECFQCLAEVEQHARSMTPPSRHALARVTAIHCYIACHQGDLSAAERFSEEALRELPLDDVTFRAGIHGALGDTYREQGHWDKARENYLKTFDYMQSPFARFHLAHVFGALADLDLRQGHLRAAAENWRKGIAAIEDRANRGLMHLPESGWLYLRLSELYYEWNELDEARHLLLRGLERAELAGDVRSRIAGYLTAARIDLAEGEIGAAASSIEQARPLIDEAPFPDLTAHFERVRLEIWLAQGKLRSAIEWANAVQRDHGLGERPGSEMTHLTLSRSLITKGDAASREQALTLLHQLHSQAKEEGRRGVEIESLALIGLAQWAAGERTGAMTSLEGALRLAEPEGYIRLFVDLGLPMGRLLQEARSRDVMPEYVSTLLEAADGAAQPGATGKRVLPEPLSARELEVLGLIAAGLTNREIAGELVISSQTVKKHAENIYGKLGVRGRTEAVIRARELNMLG